MTTLDLLFVVAYSAGIAAVVGLVAWTLLRLIAGARIIIHLVTVVVAAVAAVVGGVLVAAQAMYLSDTDVQLALAIAVTSGIVAIAVAVLLGARISRAARVLGDAARDLGAGVAVSPSAASTLPVGEFRTVLREMADSDARLRDAREEVERQEAARSDLVVRIAHDLRVPLAGIRAQAEALQDGLAPDPDRYLDQIAAQVDRVNRLVDDLFAISRIDAGTLALRLQPTSLGDLASDVAADLRAVADAAEIDLSVEVDADATIDADPLQLGRAIANLVANALQHAPDGGHVRVRVTVDDEWARVIVVDDGPGIPDADRDHLFDAGWRGTAARSPHALDVGGGAGLGLAIARGVVQAHGGHVDLEDTGGGGAEFVIALPVAAPLSAVSAPASRP
ncbi:HAMP domain-containing sensor histidine kinase [Microbacterium sp. ET2]|uniref:sensor histidine kinase n=1 Tax=Microbacterium albipurpureum TaxID=3050384 RepID=UPI00259CFB71|nr:HAMP domain-containing sensor histidine kinase [Microbacterium sp. ET2 (Ac-2212)]WJL96607.1 HAMP domain-containing sensor histidine kinase [Microbacterium sp. ET2 (Ac-2212)]